MNPLEDKIRELLHSKKRLDKKLEEIMFLICDEQKVMFHKTKTAYKDCTKE